MNKQDKIVLILLIVYLVFALLVAWKTKPVQYRDVRHQIECEAMVV